MIRWRDIRRGLGAALPIWCAARLLGVEVQAANTLAAFAVVIAALASSGGRRQEQEDQR